MVSAVLYLHILSCADPESLVKGVQLFFSLMSGGKIQIPLLAGHHRPASETLSNALASYLHHRLPYLRVWTGIMTFSKVTPCRATKCSIHNMLSRGAYCVPCIHNMLPLKSGAYCVGHVSYLHNMLPS